MLSRILITVVVAALGWPVQVAAEEKTSVSVAVMEFASKGGVTQKQMDALGDMLANEIRDMGGYRVIGSADIRAVLKIEEQKSLMGCSDVACMAEIGGALGVRWVVVGNVSKFGELYLLNLKMMDAEKVRVASSISKRIRGGEEILVESLPAAIRNLFAKARPIMHPGAAAPPEPKTEPPKVASKTPETKKPPPKAVPEIETGAPSSPFSTWGHVAFWSGLGLAAFGAVGIWQAEVAADDWVQTGDQSLADKHETWNGVAYMGFGVGGALMITGAVLWLLKPGDGQEEKSPAVSAGPTPDGHGLMFGLGGRW